MKLQHRIKKALSAFTGHRANNPESINPKPTHQTESTQSANNLKSNTVMREHKHITSTTESRINTICDEIAWYITEVLGGNPEDIDLMWNNVGACFHYVTPKHTIQFRMWERSEGHLGIPDMSIIVITLTFKVENAETDLRNFRRELMMTSRINGFRYIADENEPPLRNGLQVPGCRIACADLYDLRD